MSEHSAVLSLPYVQPSQAQKHVTHNEALLRLDALVQASVEARDQTAPPSAPLAGARFIVPAGGTGAWSGQVGSIAYFDGVAWLFLSPQPGWRAYVLVEELIVTYDTANGWQDGSGDVLRVGQLGVSASPDETNRLSVSSTATLLNHDGAGHQLKLNKAASGDTVSLLYQSNWSGRAEMGLVGDDQFSIKVSADGTNFSDAVRIDASSAVPTMPNGLTVTGNITGTAVTQGPADATANRLIRAADGYVKSTVVGAVTQSGGIPTGAIIERGTSANGDYIRYADGTQICTHNLQLVYNSQARLSAVWTYPAAFSVPPTMAFTADLNDLLSNSTPSPEDVGPVWSGTPGTTWTRAWLYRLSGMTNFASTNTCKVWVTAIGRWF